MNDAEKLIRARSTLNNIKEYFDLQLKCCERGEISPGLTWQDVYKQVSKIVYEWSDKALEETGGDFSEQEEKISDELSLKELDKEKCPECGSYLDMKMSGVECGDCGWWSCF